MKALDESWRAWVRENVARGCATDELFRILLQNGFDRETAALELGIQAEGPDPRLLPKLRRIETARPAELYTAEDFLTPDECAHLVELMRGYLRPSTITVENEPDQFFRRSKTCDLSFLEDDTVRRVDERLCAAVRVHPAYAEPTQAQRYDVGDEFKAHTDYFEAYELERFSTSTLGQRTWTFMVYLNEPDGGGATRFTSLGLDFEPKTGMAVIWNSLHPDGTPNPDTLHHGMPVTKGYKAILTKWFRRPRGR